MTPHELFAEGRLVEAVALQEAAVADRPADPAARLFLVELLAFAGRLTEARSHLDEIDSDDPGWPASRQGFRRLLRAEWRRAAGRRPVVLPEPAPRHARCRWRAVRCLRDDQPEEAVNWVDRADESSPDLAGFLDGQEFDGLRDADDRFASVLEVFAGGDYLWVPWEAVRRVALRPARYALDRLFRPADLRLTDGTELAVHLPLVYPGSHEADDEFALGLETDRVCPDGGPVRCVGGKLLMVGAAEVPLAECRMIEVR
ncbi:MAG: tetratricopeptide repeat protein [Gemmataceae bacterium]|nr:tetratricopeptide repeat protein [Gemmataceae bacterium]